jgi:hypothetical protein
MVLLFLLDGLTSLDIRSQALKSFVYFGLLIGTPSILIYNLVALRSIGRKTIGAILPTVVMALILLGGPMEFLFSAGAWRTQDVLYQNEDLRFKTVEFQMQDVGAFGYNKRTVEVIRLTPLLMITHEVPRDIDKKIEWVKVDKHVNELGLKGG